MLLKRCLTNLMKLTAGRKRLRRRGRSAALAYQAAVLECRTLLAGVTDTGTTLNIELAANEQVTVLTDGSAYQFASNNQNFTDGGVAESAAFSGFDSNALTFSDLTKYDFVSITDGGGNARVVFEDSGTNQYVHHFGVDLSGESTPSNSVVFRGGNHFGNFNITVNSDRAIHLDDGADLTTVDGILWLTAHNMGDASSSVRGITMNNASITTMGSGDVILSGRATDLETDLDHKMGIWMTNASRILSTSTSSSAGTISVTGIGGQGVGQNYGLQFSTDTLISSARGNIVLVGNAGLSSGGGNRGIRMSGNTIVESTGTTPAAGTISITGTGGDGTDRSEGVLIESNSIIRSVMGAVTITGTGGTGNGFGHKGAVLFGGHVTSTGVGEHAATITINGTAGDGGDFNEGVLVAQSATVTSADGAILLNGTTGANTGHSNRAITVRNDAVIESTGVGVFSASIRLIGQATTGTRFNEGVLLNAAALIRSVDGSIEIEGAGGNGTESTNRGVGIFESQVRSTGSSGGLIIITGTGGTGSGFSRGVSVGNNSVIEATTGTVVLLGTGGTGGNHNHGVEVTDGSSVSTGPGTLSIDARASSGDSRGLLMRDAVAMAGSGNMQFSTLGNGAFSDFETLNTVAIGSAESTGPIVIFADTIDLSTETTVQSSGSLSILQTNPGTTVGLGGAQGTLNLTDEELTTLQDGFSSIRLGNADATAVFEVNTATFTDDLILVGGTLKDLNGTDITAPSVRLDIDVLTDSLPQILNIAGDAVLGGNRELHIQVDGMDAGNGPGFHDQLAATGSVDLGGSFDLRISVGDEFSPAPGDEFVIVKRDGGTGILPGIAEGRQLSSFHNAVVSYVGGDGDDVSLTIPPVAPQILGPLGNAEGQRPEFTWEAIPGAESYQLWLVHSSGGSGDPVINTIVDGTSFTPTEDLRVGRYRTWVRANLPGGVQTDWVDATFGVSVKTTIHDVPFFANTRQPTFSWDPVAFSSGTRIYVTNTTTQENGVIDAIVPDNEYNVLEDLAFGRYRIWVRIAVPGGYQAEWSEPVDYFVGPEPVAPVAPTRDATPEFTWTAIERAATHQVYVVGPSGVVINESDLAGTSFIPTDSLPNGDYRWWVRGFTAAGRPGPWSQRQEFTTGGRTQVTSVSRVINTRVPTFEWPEVPETTAYEIYVSKVGDSGPVIREAFLTDNSYSAKPLENGDYQVWIRTTGSVRDPWGRGVGFTIDEATSGTAVTPLTPNTAGFETSPEFTWEASATAASYDIYLHDGVRGTIETGLNGTSWTPATPLPSADWTWYVRSVNSSGVVSPWSSGVEFSTSARTSFTTLPPTAAPPSFAWTPVSEAERYQLVVTGNDIERSFRENNIVVTFYTPTEALPTGVYQAWVRAVSPNGSFGVWSLVQSFTAS